MLEPRKIGTPPPLVIELDLDLVRQLRPAAARRDLNVKSLVLALLDVIAVDQLTDAILDDVDTAEP